MENIDIPKEKGKTISKQENTNVGVEPKKNITITPPKDYSSIKAPKRMYSNGSTYINRTILDDEYTPKEVKPINQKSSKNHEAAKAIIVFGIILVVAVVLVAIIVNAKKPRNTDSNWGSQQQVDNRPVEIYYSWSWPETNVIRVYLSCSTTHYGKKVKEVYGRVEYKEGNYAGHLDVTIPLKRTPFDISVNSDENDDYGYVLWFHYEKIIYEDGTEDSYSGIEYLI